MLHLGNSNHQPYHQYYGVFHLYQLLYQIHLGLGQKYLLQNNYLVAGRPPLIGLNDLELLQKHPSLVQLQESLQ